MGGIYPGLFSAQPTIADQTKNNATPTAITAKPITTKPTPICIAFDAASFNLFATGGLSDMLHTFPDSEHGRRESNGRRIVFRPVNDWRGCRFLVRYADRLSAYRPTTEQTV